MLSAPRPGRNRTWCPCPGNRHAHHPPWSHRAGQAARRLAMCAL